MLNNTAPDPFKGKPPTNPNNTMRKTFTSNPPGYNQTTKFSSMHRDSNASNGLFLGSPFSMTQAGPGSYPGIDKSTLTPAAPSKTRAQTLNRRVRDCRPLVGPAATLSLHGADRLLMKEEAPSPGNPFPSTFAEAKEKKGYCTSVFASEASRFLPTRVLGSGLERGEKRESGSERRGPGRHANAYYKNYSLSVPRAYSVTSLTYF